MIYLMGKYHEGDWIAAWPFLIIGVAVFIVLRIAERPESDDEEELLNNYRKSFNKIPPTQIEGEIKINHGK